MTYDIFTDASVDKSLRGACAGAIAIKRETNTILFENYAIQTEGTNNSGEICGILLAVFQAKEIKSIDPTGSINIFSDSLVSLKGMRDWLFSWITLKRGNVLYKSDRNQVLNQNYHKLIYSTIVFNSLKINFYHVRGHINQNTELGLNTLITTFARENIIPLSSVADPNYVLYYNDMIDNTTRDYLKRFLTDGSIPSTGYIDDLYRDPYELYPIPSDKLFIDKYRWLIGKTKIRPDII